MVHLMKSGDSESQAEKMAAVKMEVEDSLEEEHAPLHKRPKQQSLGLGFTVPASQYNPLNEPSPLGLRLRKSPSLLELIQMKLSESTTAKVGSHGHVKSRYEGDLVAKCYFAKHKLVWEVLDGGLKNKIEIQWSDIMALKANYPDDGPGTLDVVLARQPLFFRETNPQPRKHTLWQATSDFTGGQASVHRASNFSSKNDLDALGRHSDSYTHETPSPCSEREESNNFGASTSAEKVEESIHNEDSEGISGSNKVSSMSRKDSVGDLLLNLPRIASLPQFLFNISEDLENQAR
ncbi:UNVERIFIED_CONTAM: hypothetical protein Scaly_0165000 [Sesamum calycinum]|uniref:TRF2/HOY1 PH-like domain-containing protein n=1 Tax=Sesamum calycinum TaxID=2727403 RepID=A0AAW2T048_9LAMI